MMKVSNKFKITSKTDKDNKKQLLEAQLCQINGITQAKAHAIVKNYQSITELIDTIENLGKEEFAKTELIVGVGVSSRKTKIGNAISEKLFQMFCK